MGITDSVIKTLGFGEVDGNFDLDIATGLTRCQKNVIKKSWILLRSKQKENGIALFVMLFARYPGQRKYFRLFSSTRREDLEMSAVMRAHGTTVMATIGLFVDSLEDAPCFSGLVQKMAKNHVRRGIPVEHFQVRHICKRCHNRVVRRRLINYCNNHFKAILNSSLVCSS